MPRRVMDPFDGVSRLSETRELERRHASGAGPFIGQHLRPNLNLKHDRAAATDAVQRLSQTMTAALPNTKAPWLEHPKPVKETSEGAPKPIEKTKEGIADDKFFTDFKIYLLDAGGKGLEDLKNDNDDFKMAVEGYTENDGDGDAFGGIEYGGGDSKGGLGTTNTGEPGDANPQDIPVTETVPDVRVL